MSNPLYQPSNPMGNFLTELNKFRQSFQGDPRAKVQELLNSGQMTQEQFNQLAQQTNEIMKFFK